jgi:hypothetical protein
MNAAHSADHLPGCTVPAHPRGDPSALRPSGWDSNPRLSSGRTSALVHLCYQGSDGHSVASTVGDRPCTRPERSATYAPNEPGAISRDLTWPSTRTLVQLPEPFSWSHTRSASVIVQDITSLPRWTRGVGRSCTVLGGTSYSYAYVRFLFATMVKGNRTPHRTLRKPDSNRLPYCSPLSAFPGVEPGPRRNRDVSHKRFSTASSYRGANPRHVPRDIPDPPWD